MRLSSICSSCSSISSPKSNNDDLEDLSIQPSWELHFTYWWITKLFPTLVLSFINIIFSCCQTHPNMVSAKVYLIDLPIVEIGYLKLLPFNVPFINRQKYGMTKFTKFYATEHALKCMNTLHIQISKFKCNGFRQWLCQICCIHSMHLDQIYFVHMSFALFHCNHLSIQTSRSTFI